MTTRDWAQRYIDAGYQVVPLKPRTKEPYAEGWLKLVFQPDDFDPNDNIGLRSVNGLVAIDLDSVEAVAVADDFLPPTEMVYGRPSKLRSKRWYRSTFSKIEPFKLDNRMVVEIRAEHQDMAPPSIHPTSGERLEWATNGAPAEVAPEALRRACRLIVTTTLVARNYAAPGTRHQWMLDLAGLFRTFGISHEEANKVVEGAARLADEPKLDDRLLEVRTTYAHTEGVSVLKKPKAFVDALMKLWPPVGDENTILVVGGKMDEILDRVEAKLLDSDEPIYQRGGKLVTPVRLEELPDLSGGVKRQGGSLVLSPLGELKLGQAMGRVVKWQSRHTPIDPPPTYAKNLLARGEWKFPALRAVVNTPLLRRDGSVLDTPGFDAATGLLLDFDARAFPRVPTAPTKADAAVALEKLDHLLRGFPFDCEAARSVALAAILTAPVRPVMETAPLFAFDAPTRGTGKSMLVELVGLVATGAKPPAMNQGKSAEETEKRLFAVLRAGDTVIHLDNCELPVEGDFLCSMLTQEMVQSRILQLSETLKLPSTALVMASGNNLSIPGDMVRRAVICRLDAKVEKPAEREFDFNCHAEAKAQRPELVIAVLTVLRAYALAGFPVKLKKPMGSFADFDWIRGALVWLGREDPQVTQDGIFAADEYRDEDRDVMALWETALKDEWIEVAEIAKRADAVPKEYNDLKARGPIIELRDKLIEVARCRVWNGKVVGRWLARRKDKLVSRGDDRWAFRCKDSRNGLKWTLVCEPKQPPLPNGAGPDDVVGEDTFVGGEPEPVGAEEGR